MYMNMRGTIAFCTCLHLSIRHALVKICGLSHVNRYPLPCFRLLGKDDISSYLSKLCLNRVNPVSVFCSGRSDPVNVRLAQDLSLLLQLLTEATLTLLLPFFNFHKEMPGCPVLWTGMNGILCHSSAGGNTENTSKTHRPGCPLSRA